LPANWPLAPNISICRFFSSESATPTIRMMSSMNLVIVSRRIER
jgi:hypothetical protein